jgi:hypothetical protein
MSLHKELKEARRERMRQSLDRLLRASKAAALQLESIAERDRSEPLAELAVALRSAARDYERDARFE